MNFRLPLLVLATALAAAGCSPKDEGEARGAGGPPVGPPAAAVPVAIAATMRDAVTARRFASTPDRGELAAYPNTPVVRRDGAYTWHRADLSESHARRAIGSTLSFRAPTGEQLQFRYERHVDHANGDWTWIGSIVGRPIEEAIITFGSKAAFGTIAQAGKEALRLTTRDGVSWLVETDPRQIALLNNVGTRPTEPDFVVAPEVIAGAMESASSDSDSDTDDGEGMSASSTTVNGVTRIDLLLGYTPGFVEYYGGESQALTRLNNMVDITNESYINSQMATQVRLVKSMLVNYTDTNTNKLALEEVTGFQAPSTQTTPHPAFSELRNARETYGADLVSVVRRFNTPENEGCGIAWLIGGGKKGGISSSSEFFGYSIVSDGRDAGTDGKTYFCRDETLAHEIGHNLGSAHDRDASDGDDNVLQNNEYGVFEYSFGQKTASDGGNFYTVMAYGDSGQTRHRVFSNPRITYCGGLACGVENVADNARSQTNTFPSVAAFRAEKTITDQPAPTKPALRDVNIDGRSDVVLHNVNSGELYAWLMNGTTISTGQGNASVPIGHGAIGSGDFNGDGRVDIVSASSVDVRISYGQSTGFGATAVVTDRPPGVWAFAGATDVNADGKSDLIWHHRGSGELYYWLMNGNTIVGGNGNAYLPIGHAAIATADFDGDGRGDVLSASDEDVRVSFSRSNGVYTAPAVIANRPAVGWAFAGAGDVNADGRADVVWHNVNSGELYYWLMSGSSIAGGQGASYLPPGFAAVTLGDFNGDSRADIVAASAGDVRVALAQSTSGFAAAVSINSRPPAGWKFVDNVERPRTAPFNDVDADGRSDAIWRNLSSGELYYWQMSGSTIVGERGATYLPAGFMTLATGDFNTDGRADVVATNGVEVRVSLALPAGGFASAAYVANLPNSSWAFGGVADIDADGRGDIVWNNKNSGELYYWLMNGSSIVGGQGAAYVPVGHRVIATGDYNGDGQADVLSANDAEVRVSFALASGSFGPSTHVSTRPSSGWVFGGSADINADGRSDVLWHNTNSGELYYWSMNGATIVGGLGGAYLPAGYSVLAMGDFNGDGRADALSANSLDVRVSLAEQTGGFASPAVIGNRPSTSSWSFVAPR